MNFPHSSDPWSGRLIGERQRYRLGLRLGEGGMGCVFLAMDTLLGQQVALKLLKETLVGSEELRKRFEREVALSAALKSDHIVQVTDFGVSPEGHPFYVMEYLHGQTLGQLLRHEKQLSAERTVDIISQVCEGLQLAHEGVALWRDGATTREHVSVVHRDLKPDNIFLVPKAQGDCVKILDFGIAKIRDNTAEQTNLTSMFIGTVHYAAPEQLGVAQDLDGRADIYSLGIILYEMLSGTDPFGLGLNINKISGISWVVAHTSKPAVPLRSQPDCEHLSPALEAVVMRCLQKAPLERFASVDKLNQALQAAVVPSAVSGRTSPQQYPRHQNTYQQLQQTLLLSQKMTEATEVRTQRSTGGSSGGALPPAQSSAPIGSGGASKAPDQECEQETTVNIRQLYPFNQEPRQHLQQSLEPGKKIINGLEAKATEKYNSHAIPPSSIPQGREHQRKARRLLLQATTGIAATLVALSLAHYAYTQWQADRVASAILENTKTLKAENKYEECVNQAKAVPQKSSFYAVAQNTLNECQRLVQDEKWLAQAQELAKKKNFKAAIATVSAIHSDSGLHSLAEQLTNQWSKNLLNQAEGLYKQSYNSTTLEKAIDITKAIPKTSSVAQNVGETIKKWRTEWNQNETYLQEAENALKQGKAQEAIDKTNRVRLLGQDVKQDTPYWQNKMKPIIVRAKGFIAASAMTAPLPPSNPTLRLPQASIVQPHQSQPLQIHQSAPTQTYRPWSIQPRRVPTQTYRPRSIQPRRAPTQPLKPQKSPSAWTTKVL